MSHKNEVYSVFEILLEEVVSVADSLRDHGADEIKNNKTGKLRETAPMSSFDELTAYDHPLPLSPDGASRPVNRCDF